MLKSFKLYLIFSYIDGIPELVIYNNDLYNKCLVIVNEIKGLGVQKVIIIDFGKDKNCIFVRCRLPFFLILQKDGEKKCKNKNGIFTLQKQMTIYWASVKHTWLIARI